jgi:hypothetical protein
MSLAASVVPPTAARADEATDKARTHYETGLELFYAREHAQALIEFQRAHEVKPRPATLFMMGQCEYLLGALRQARDHYEAYLRDSPTGEFVEVARDRIESINRRPATLVINTVPDQVDVRITPAAASGEPSPTGAPPGGGHPPSDSSPTGPPAGEAHSPSDLSPTGASSGKGHDPLDLSRTRAGAEPLAVISGQAPNNFSVPSGRWLITVSKPSYQSQRIVVEVEVAETKPLFFKLDPIPARLEVETLPAGATLFVNGNRTENPYRQDVAPGRVELFAQAPDYADRREDFILAPGDRRLLLGPNDAFQLRYVQRSGRPELLVASMAMGALIGAGALAGTIAYANELEPGNTNIATVSLTLGGALAGGIGGALLGNRFVPTYIPDNRALFIIGGMWIGVAEGALTGMFVNQALTTTTVHPKRPDLGPYLKRPELSLQLKAAFIGSLPGIVIGTTAGALLAHRAPTYGRVALIQSAAVGGAVLGSLVAVALKWEVFRWQKMTTPNLLKPDGNPILVNGLPQPDYANSHIEPADASILDLSLPSLIGLNVGLGAGLLGAYLPDQSRYGPSWTRVALIDLAAAAGALGLGIAACVDDDKGCLTAPPQSMARARTASAALLGGAAGVVAGILLTRNVDAVRAPSSDTPPPSIAILPMPTPGGGVTPLLGAMGFF